MRDHYKDSFAKRHGVKLGFMSPFIKATAFALSDQPIVNAVIDGTDIVYRDYIDISVAVATPKVSVNVNPNPNAIIDGTDIVHRDYIDISVAVVTPKTLTWMLLLMKWSLLTETCYLLLKENLQGLRYDGSTPSPPSLGSPSTAVVAAVRRTGSAQLAAAGNSHVPLWGRSISLGGKSRWGGDPASSTSPTLIDLSISPVKFDRR